MTIGQIMVAAILTGLALVVCWTVVFNVRGRRHERQMSAERGTQTASDFASLFDTHCEQLIAKRIFPYLQLNTFTRQFSFRLDDLLWEPPLRFVQDQIADDLRSGFWDELELGLTADDETFSRRWVSAKTVGELVHAIAAIYRERYGKPESA